MAATESQFADGNKPPEIDLNGEAEGTDSRIRYAGNSPAKAIAPDAFAWDDSEDFEGGGLIVEFTEKSTADDWLGIVSPRFGDPLVHAVDKALYYGDSVIGSIAGGTDGSPLSIDFRALVTADVVQAVIRSIGYANLSREPVEGERFVSFTLFDREGAASRAGATIDVVAGAPPEIDLNGAAIKYVENSLAAAIAPEAFVFDDSQDFSGGGLMVRFADGATVDDQLQIVGTPFGDSAIYAIENDLYFRDAIIGSITGGTDGASPLLIDFHAKVTAELVEAVVRSIGYANFSQAPVEGERFVTFTLFDRDGAAGRAAATIYVVPVDTPAVAVDDTVTTTEDKVGTGNLFDANGPGNDHDPDTSGLRIAAVNGSAADVGQTVTLKSGAKLTVYKDGTYVYDPDGRFDALTDNTSGAVNSYAVDSFQYTLAGGGTATVTVIVTGVAGPDDKLMGDEGGNTIKGAVRSDQFMLQQGGEDLALAGAGNDLLYFGAALSAGDVADGGDGRDALVLQGYVTAVLNDTNLAGIESISLQTGANAE
ncbi:MAG TPA: Ig-like domain-containing protein [Allosphingosinicella sp.]